MKRLATTFALAALGLSAFAADIDRALAFPKQIEGKVFRDKVEPHWLPDGKRFWYRVKTAPSVWEYVLVEAETGQITRAPDAAKLALPKLELTSAASPLEIRATERTGEDTQIVFTNRTNAPVELFWVNQQNQRKSYGKVEPGTSRDMSTYAGHVWLVADAKGEPLAVIEAKAEALTLTIDGKGKPPEPKKSSPRETSPDDRWQVRFEKNQVTLRDKNSGEVTTLTTDGTATHPYRGPVAWSPDAQSFVLLSVKEVAPRQVTIVEAKPEGQLQPKIHTFPYQKPGDELPHPRPVLFRLSDRQPLRIANDLFPNPFTPGGNFDIRWSPRGDEFYFDYNQRGHQLWRLLAVNAQTGAVRIVVEEKARTFIDYTAKTWRHWLDETRELLWMSERDGWCHLWLYDSTTGTVKNQITHGAWVVRNVERVDERKRQVWFLASGLHAGEDPYQRHLCRVNFDGTGFAQLTAGDGDHAIKFSPDQRFFTDTWSRADQPPVSELRRSEDGKLVCELERADTRALLAAGWTMPERFVAKGRDGKTDIHGIIVKPANFDPARKYPVLEEVYAGPHGAFAPKTFGTLARQHSYAGLGFIVVKADGMGTNHRGKAFHDVAWKNLQDAGFPDRIAWLKAAAVTRPWMDLSRVGIFGGSAGGQNAMRALLDHTPFYKAAFADCGCHDNRMDKIWWNEQWLGWPIDDSYVQASNVVAAPKLQGSLMLCVGELDRNVDPASTMQVAAALQKAGKPFDLLVVAGTGHGAAETPYANRRRMEFFVQKLGGESPLSSSPVAARTDQIAGWTVIINHRLIAEQNAATQHALAMLEAQLGEIVRVVPAPAVTELRKVPLWISPEYPGIGPRAEYHPNADWLRANQRDVAMAKSVEFTNVRIFDAEVKRMPVFVLHELAHAYHDRILGFDHPEILAAYHHAKEAKLYDAVERRRADGRPNSRERAYAITNHKEYFAETTEAFFGTNDFYPFNREQLAQHDPVMFKLLERLWQTQPR